MGIINSNKVLDTERIDCGGTLKVTLALTAAPDIQTSPTDIVLVLDRSGSMEGEPLKAMKAGANAFIDILSEATGGKPDGQIGSGSRIGLVSFSETAAADTGLVTSVADLHAAVNRLVSGGSTNHAAAFTEAVRLLGPDTGKARVIVLFTDGNTTAGIPPAPVAAAARAQGIVIYCIGLVGKDGLDVSVLNTWASDPDSAHVAVTPNADDLKALFEELAANITKTGATRIVIEEKTQPDFVITGVLSPGKGTAVLRDAHNIRWTIPQLGVNGTESAVLEFYIRHNARTPGKKKVNASVRYTDAEGNQVRFPDPEVQVECSVIVWPEPCPEPEDFTVQGCEDTVTISPGETQLSGRGQILQVNTVLRQVCPNQRVALAAVLTEVDQNGREYPRGVKIMTIPAHHYDGCRDIQVRRIQFVVPEDRSMQDGQEYSPCSPRKYRVRFIAHAADTGYRCTETEIGTDFV